MGAPIPTDNESVTRWIRECADGNPEARGKLYEFYYDEMIRTAEKRLSRLPANWDAEEFVQSGVMSLFRWMDRSGTEQPSDRNEFRRLIGAFVRRKVARRIERETAQKRGGGKTVTETDLGASIAELDAAVDQLRPTVDEALAVADLVEQLLSRLGKEDREIVSMALQGFTNVDIAKVNRRTEAAIRQKRKRISAKCEWVLSELDQTRQS